LNAYAFQYRLDLFSNFTFFANDPVYGDQIEQSDVRTVAGFDARYQRRLELGGIPFRTTAGVNLRSDEIRNELFHTVQRERLAPRVSADIQEGALGVFLEEDTEWTSWLRSVLGLRADAFEFQVSDRLEDLGTTGARTSGTAQALRVSPKASVVLTPHPVVDLYLNFGRGFHSNDARGVVRAVDPVTPLAAATGYELGARTRLFRRLDLAAAAWALDLESEIVWVGDEGTTEARPATRRRGVEAEARYRVTPWLRADADVTWTWARFTEETGGGRFVPLAPTWTWAGGLEANHPSGFFGSLRFHGLADRPANESGSLVAEGFTLFDLEAGYEQRWFRVSAAVRNLFDVEWRQAQFANESRLSYEPVPVEDLHFTPGYPLTVFVSVAGRL
jgi:outer membrane receptor protein involved in Fe transport